MPSRQEHNCDTFIKLSTNSKIIVTTTDISVLYRETLSVWTISDNCLAFRKGYHLNSYHTIKAI